MLAQHGVPRCRVAGAGEPGAPGLGASLTAPPLPQDEKLTKEEILDNWNMFVGSQATNYGEDLTKSHDEL